MPGPVKGCTRVGGRKKGTPNKRTAFSVAARLEELDYDLIGKILDDINQVDDIKARVKYHLQLLEYCDAKRKAIEVVHEQDSNPAAEWLRLLSTEQILQLVKSTKDTKGDN